MSAGARSWTVRLTAAAEVDFEEILRWTMDQFGKAQARIEIAVTSLNIAKLLARWIGRPAESARLRAEC